MPKAARPKHWKGRWKGQAQKWFALAFTGTDADIDIMAHGDEFDAWKWTTKRELIQSIVPFKRAVYEAVVKEFDDPDRLTPALSNSSALRGELGRTAAKEP